VLPATTTRPLPTPHPIKGVLASRRLTNVDVARAYGCSRGHVGRVVNGYMPPSAKFRAFLAELLELPEAALFDLDRRYWS
jgi:transcriptional regulator with XRE-family HTH domain